MSRTNSPWRARDIHVAQVIKSAWDRARWTFDIAEARSGINRNRLQSIRACGEKGGTAISVGESWALLVPLGLNALDVLDGGDGTSGRGSLGPRPRGPVSDPDGNVVPLPRAAQTRNVQDEHEGHEQD